MNCRLILAPRKIDVLKTNICPRNEALKASMLVLIKNNKFSIYKTDSCTTTTLYCLYLLFTTARAQLKNE